MSKRQQQTAFLRTLILHGNAETRVQLQERIKRAERDEQCAWRALLLVSVLAVLSCVGICYSAVLLPEFFQNASHLIVRIFCSVGLASLVCAVAFLGCWMWCRAVLNRVQEDCRRHVMAMLEPAGPVRSPLPDLDTELRTAHLGVAGGGENTGSTLVPAYPNYSQLFSIRRSS